MNCPFCERRIDRFAFLASENFLVIYNRSPFLPGHSLVIPKNHFESLLDLPQPLASEMMGLSVHAARLLKEVFHAGGFDWTIQDGEEAGQTVSHLHLHLIPRTKGDLPDPGEWFMEIEKSKHGSIDRASRPRLSEGQLIEITRRIRQNIPEAQRFYKGSR